MTVQAHARRGHTRIAQAALRHTMEAVAADAFGVRRDDVFATLKDDTGRLGVDLLVRLPPPPLTRRVLGAQEQHSAFERASIARLRISSMGQQVTGMECGRINIRLAGAGRPVPEKRVDHRQGRRKP
ncbi:hypothetical protein ACTAQI_13505 [Pseudarthrobacter sp. alpha12b]